MGKLPEDKFQGVKLVSPAPTIDREAYEQKSGIEYQVEFFDLYEKGLKTDLCWAIDTKNLELLEHAYKEARKVLGVSKGRPKSIPPHIQQYREEAKRTFAFTCLNYWESRTVIFGLDFFRIRINLKNHSPTHRLRIGFAFCVRSILRW